MNISPLLATALTALAILPLSTPAAAQDAPRTDSGVLKRIPLDEWMSDDCEEAKKRGEIVVCGRPEDEPVIESPPPESGDRKTDVQAERAALVAPGDARPSVSCSSVGSGGEFGCSKSEYDAWYRERQAQKKRERVPDPQ